MFISSGSYHRPRAIDYNRIDDYYTKDCSTVVVSLSRFYITAISNKCKKYDVERRTKKNITKIGTVSSSFNGRIATTIIGFGYSLRKIVKTCTDKERVVTSHIKIIANEHKKKYTQIAFYRFFFCWFFYVSIIYFYRVVLEIASLKS